MRALKLWIATIAALSAVGCSETESTITGSYGESAISGQVVTVGDLAGQSAAGIEVRARGTGITVVTDSTGKFRIFGVPAETTELSFQRGEEVSASVDVHPAEGDVLVQLSRRSASKSRRRGVGHPGTEIEGIVKSISATSIVVTDARSKQDLDSEVNEKTIIRKGNRTLTVEDIKVGDRVHVKALHVDGKRVAVEIKLQSSGDDSDDSGDDGDATATANGIVEEVGADYLMVRTADGRLMRVNVDEQTIIKRRGRVFPLADIKPGDRAECLGTRIDDTTILARKIETQDRQ